MWSRRAVWPWSTRLADFIELGGAALLALLLAILLWVHLRGRNHVTRWLHVAWIALVAITLTAHVLRSRGPYRFQAWDLFHTVLGAKYLPELGYHRLYDCVYRMGYTDAERVNVKTTRDLRTFEVGPAERVESEARCRARFGPARLAEFERDADFFLHGRGSRLVVAPSLLLDFGYFGTPFHASIVRAVFEHLEVGYRSLFVASFIDDGLIAGALVLVFVAFGIRAGLMTAALVAFDVADHTLSMGGSFLKHSYLAYLLATFALLRLERPKAAGVVLGIATAEKLFPGFFFVAYGVHALLETRRERRAPRGAVGFAAAFACALGVSVGVSVLWGGWHEWGEYISRMIYRERGFFAVGIGLKPHFIVGSIAQYIKTNTMPRASWLYYPAAFAVAVFGARVLERKIDSVSFTALYGLLLVFTFTSPLPYYILVVAVLGVACFGPADEVTNLRRALWVASIVAVEHAIQVTANVGFYFMTAYLSPLTMLLVAGLFVITLRGAPRTAQ